MDRPRVSVVIPARNEAAHIEACVRSAVAQTVEGGLEVIVVDGSSTDGTAALARKAGAVVIENPDGVTTAALNRGLAAARGDILVRFDAHAEMPPGYVAKCVSAFEEEPDVGNVAGWREVRGSGPWGRALGEALVSPFGVGHALIWRRPDALARRREVEHVPLGTFSVATLREVGGWRNDLLANEDFELDQRLQAAGKRILFDPAISSVYRPRESLSGIARQYFRYGRWKAAVIVEHPRSLRPRQLAPLGLVTALIGAAAPTPAALPARIALGVYAGVVVTTGARAQERWRTAAVLTTLHLAWGTGLLCGLGKAAVDRGRRARPAGYAAAS
jgi:succinoglycan biosynthesis protein ExoA